MLLYLHVPYCDSKCHYCAFNSYTGMFHTKDAYFEALYKQLRHLLGQTDEPIETVFIGGGTPSAVQAHYYEKIFSLLPRSGIEITAEANPGSATGEWIKQMADMGVNRLSLGVQSFDEDKLRFLNRAHDQNMALEAIEAAKQYLERVSLDLIYNTPVDSKKLLQKDLDTFLSLGLEHISCYELTPEAGTRFADLTLPEGSFGPLIKEKLERSGFGAYEVSNYGKPSLHNLGYWQYKNYLGVGAGAIGFNGGIRYYPHSDLNAYIADPLFTKKERLSAADMEMEKIFLGLRSSVGVTSENPAVIKRLKHLADEGKLIEKRNRFYNRDFFLADEIALYLLK